MAGQRLSARIEARGGDIVVTMATTSNEEPRRKPRPDAAIFRWTDH
jgi:hypothetical protein